MDTPVNWGFELLLNTATDDLQYDAAVSALPDGRFVVVWTDWSQWALDATLSSEVKGQIFNKDGTKAGSEFLVNTESENAQSAPTITVLSDGRFVVAWTDGSGAEGDAFSSAIRAQVFNTDGTKSGDDFLVNSTIRQAQSEPAIKALPGGGFAVVWTDLSQTAGDRSVYAVRGQVFGSDGTKVGPEFLVNSTTREAQFEPAITALPDGRFVVVWTDDSETGSDTSSSAVRAQVFNADGTKSGVEFLVNTTVDSSQEAPDVTALPGGRFVVTWTDNSETGGDASLTAVKGQVFEANGTKVGPEFLVNSTTREAQFEPAITALPDGRFVVVWTDDSETGSDTSSSAVRAQVFNADGTKSGVEFLVNTTRVDAQFEPTVAALPDGRFIVTWTDESRTGGDASSSAIKGQIFDPRPASVEQAPVADDLVGTSVEEDSNASLVGYLSASDPNNDPLTFSLGDMIGGTFALDPDTGGITFKPDPNFYGTASVIYTVSDGILTDMGTFSLTVAARNDPVVAEDGTAYGVEDGEAVTGQVWATDIDNDPLTYSVVQGPPPEQGTLTLKDDGSYSFVPAKDYNGEVTFTYKASDGTMDSNVATVTITVEAQNDAAVAEAGTASGKEDDLEIKGTVLATDVDGDPLTYSLVQGPPPEQGTLILKDDGSYSFVPAKDYNGEVSFQYVANDGTVDSAPQTVVITVEAQNDAATGRVAMTCMPGTLTASHTLADVDGMSRASVSIQWQSSLDGTTWSDIAGALSPTFAPTAAQEGLQVRALALYTDQGGTEEKVASTQVARIGSAAGGPLNGTEANDILFGLSGDDAIESAGGHDVIEAGGGADTVGGGGGRDTFLASVDDGNDIYDGGRGRDVYSLAGTSARATVDLGAGTATSLQTGSDSLVGIESVIGSRGRDLFMAGAGAHELTGGRGGDVFRFGSAQAAQGDVILDFQAGRDCLHLRGIDADTGTRGNQAFTLLEVGAAFTEAGQLRYSYETDGTVAYTLIQGNVDGDVGVDFEIRLAGHKVFTTGDIVL